MARRRVEGTDIEGYFPSLVFFPRLGERFFLHMNGLCSPHLFLVLLDGSPFYEFSLRFYDTVVLLFNSWVLLYTFGSISYTKSRLCFDFNKVSDFNRLGSTITPDPWVSRSESGKHKKKTTFVPSTPSRSEQQKMLEDANIYRGTYRPCSFIKKKRRNYIQVDIGLGYNICLWTREKVSEKMQLAFQHTKKRKKGKQASFETRVYNKTNACRHVETKNALFNNSDQNR